MLRQKILKTRCLRLAKNAFAIQHLLHHSIIYTFIHYPTNFVLLRWTCISEVIPAVQVAFFLLVRVFPLNLSFYLNFYFSFLGKYFLGTQKMLWDQWSCGPILFPPLPRCGRTLRITSQTYSPAYITPTHTKIIIRKQYSCSLL